MDLIEITIDLTTTALITVAILIIKISKTHLFCCVKGMNKRYRQMNIVILKFNYFCSLIILTQLDVKLS